MRRNAQRLKTLERQLIHDLMAWLEKHQVEQVRFTRPFVVNLDAVSPAGDDWGTEAMVITHIDLDGSVSGEGSEHDPVRVADLQTHEIAFLLDELEEGNYSID